MRVSFGLATFGRRISEGSTVEDGGDALAAGFKPIRIFEGRGGQLFTLDNRRLLIFSQAGRSAICLGDVKGSRRTGLEVHCHGRAGRRLVYSGEVMELHERVIKIENKADLVGFVEALRKELQEKPDEWENPTLDSYLSALARWLEDSDGYYRNQGRSIPENPSWRNIAEMLIAAKMYE